MAASREEAVSGEPMIAEAVGPPLPLHEVAAAMAMGVIALLVAGVMPVLLGGLVDTHRLTAAQIGQTATVEGLAMGVFTAVAGAMLRAEGLRFYAAGATIALVLCDLATTQLSGTGVVIARALAGMPEGVLLWITISMIARSQMPERLAGIFIATATAMQFVLAVIFTAYVLPVFGSNGGFVGLAVATLPALAIGLFVPKGYAPLVKPEGETTSPPLRGWAALAATVVFTAAYPAVAVYLQPLAHEAGLDAGVARLALTVTLLTQVIGGSVAAALGGRVHYMVVFCLGTITFLLCWAVMGMTVPAMVFIAANAVLGFAYLIMVPFLVPMLIEADPSRRAAVLGGGAQVVAGALGPLCASLIVTDANVHGALWLGTGFVLTGLLMMAGMYVAERRERAHRQVAVVEPAP